MSFLQRQLFSIGHNKMEDVAYSAGIGKEVGSNGLNVAVVGLAELAHGCKVLVASPSCRQDRQWQRNCNVGHCVRCGDSRILVWDSWVGKKNTQIC